MMGRQEAGQAPLFYAFNFEDHVPASHMLRGIDHFLTWASCTSTWPRTTATPAAPRLIRAF